jgi:hypothetical protein
MKSPAFTSFAASLDHFLDTRASGAFATGQWLAWLSDDHLYRLTSLIGLALEHNNAQAWDDLVLTVIMADGAESRISRMDWNGHQIVERVTALRVIAHLESLRRQGVADVKQALTIQPRGAVSVGSTHKHAANVADIAH